MKRLLLLSVMIYSLFLVACSSGKQVSVADAPSETPTPTATSTPSPIPSPTPSPLPSPTPEGDYYTITIKVEPEGAGSVTGGGTYGLREEFTLEAIPNEGYEFVGWKENGGSLSYLPAKLSYFTVGNETYTAVFREISDGNVTPVSRTFEIKVLAFPSEGGTVKGSGEYEEGASHIVEAIPNRGWVFDGWTSFGESYPDAPAVQRFYAVYDATYIANFKKMEITPTPLPEVDEVVWKGKLGPDVTGTFWSNGTYVVSGEGATYDYWFDQPHNKAGEMLEHRYSVRKIVVEEGVTEIGTYALSWFEECREIVLPKSLKRIGKRAFESCGKSGYWGDDKFVGHDNITPPKEQWFMRCNLHETSVTHIGPRAFWATTCENIVLPETLERIDDEAFGYCQERTDCLWDDIIIPASVKQLGQYVFFNQYSIICKGKSSIRDYKLASEYIDLTEETIEPFANVGLRFEP